MQIIRNDTAELKEKVSAIENDTAELAQKVSAMESDIKDKQELQDIYINMHNNKLRALQA